MDDQRRQEIKVRVTTGGNRGPHASVTALLLIAAGVLLFLDNLGILPFAHLRDYWPLLISAFGITQLSTSRCGSSIVWGLTMVAAGVFLTLGNLGILNVTIGSLWPLFLIAGGASMLVKRARPGSEAPRFPQFTAASNASSGFAGNQLHEYAVFSSVNRRIDSQNFEGADLNSTFGEIKLDLRGASICTPNKEATIEANSAFGAIKLRVPETWRVVVRGTAVFGAYEDKTVPPRPGPGVDSPTLIITGGSAFGAVEIEN